MIDPKQIPDEVVEAAARADYEMIRGEYREDFGGDHPDHPPWQDLHDTARDYYLKHARAAIAAGINAWPDMEVRPTFNPSRIILPLPQEGDA